MKVQQAAIAGGISHGPQGTRRVVAAPSSGPEPVSGPQLWELPSAGTYHALQARPARSPTAPPLASGVAKQGR